MAGQTAGYSKLGAAFLDALPLAQPMQCGIAGPTLRYPAERKDIVMLRNLTAMRSRPAVFAAVALASALLVGLGPVSAARASSPDVTIKVFADHFVLTGLAIADLHVLESAVAPLLPRAVRLDACGIVADLAQRAAAHRFRHLNLELRVLEPDAPACRIASAAVEMPAGRRPGQAPSGIDEKEVDRWWHESMP